MRNIWYTLGALVFVCVLFRARCVLWCLLAHCLVHIDCSGVCLHTIWCTSSDLVFAAYYFVHIECSGVCLRTIWCTLSALVCVPAYYLVHIECSGVCLRIISCTLSALVFACVLFRAH